MGLGIEPKPDTPTTPDPAAPASALDELRAIYDAIDTGGNQTQVFDIPASSVAVRYRRLSEDETVAALTSDGEKWERNAQFLIDACEEILHRTADGSLEPVKPGAKVTFDFRPGESEPLHQALGREETDIRRSVLRLFQGAERVLLLHAQAVDAWMDDLQAKTEEKFSGG